MKTGDYVYIKKDVKFLSGYAQIAQDKNFPLFIHSLYGTSVTVLTKNLIENQFQPNSFNINISSVDKIEEKELKKVLKKQLDDVENQIKKHVSILRPKHILLKDRKIERISDRNFLSTQSNFALVLNDNTEKSYLESKSKSAFTVNQRNANAGCCAFTKTNMDVVVYIPKSWLEYFGYSQINLKYYLLFLEKCDIKFNGKITGIRTLKEIFPYVNNNVLLRQPYNNGYINVDEECYEVLIKGNKENYMITYLHFILIRYMYSSLYWNIPFIAMKMKKFMPKATHWECLLMANCYENYSNGYSLNLPTDHNLCLPSKRNNQENILHNIRNGNMNNSFKYYAIDSFKIREMIKKEDYKSIQKLINEYRDVN